MPEVQNISATDYSVPLQPANSYAADMTQIDENAPMIYNPDEEIKTKSSSRLLGPSILGLILVGTSLAAGHAWGSKGKAALQENYNNLKAVANEINTESKKVTDHFYGGIVNGNKFAKNVQEKLKPFIEDSEKIAENVASDGKKAADNANGNANFRKPTHF